MQHPFFAVVLDGAIRFQQHRLRRLYLRLDSCNVAQWVQKIGPVQLILGTLANRAVVGVAHSGSCNLQAVHAEQVTLQVPEATTQAYLLVGKADSPLHIEIIYEIIHQPTLYRPNGDAAFDDPKKA